MEECLPVAEKTTRRPGAGRREPASSACGGGRRGPGVGRRALGAGVAGRGTGGENPRRAGQPDGVGGRRQLPDSLTPMRPLIYTCDYL